MDEKDFILAFSNSVGVGPKSFLGLLKIYGNAKDAWENNSEEQYKKAGVGKVFYGKFQQFKNEFDINNYLDKLKKAKAEFIPYGDKYYPESLVKLDSPPIGLYVKGNKKLLVALSPSTPNPKIAVVGARKITSYGRQVTENLVGELCSAGFIIVSGMALGVDGVAHKTAIEQGGHTIAVLGCGVDCPYPRENDKLYEEILDNNGLVISEYPLGMPANAGTFPARNRIVAGLSGSALITEAAEGSGSLITAELALKQGKTVFAVPGPITSQMSRGAIKLLKQGAVMVSSANDILEELNIKTQSLELKYKTLNLKLSKNEQKVFESIQNEEKTIDEISRDTKIKTSELMSTLSGMELAGIVNSSSGKFSICSV